MGYIMEKMDLLKAKESGIAYAIDTIDIAYDKIMALRFNGEDDWHFFGMIDDVLLMAKNRLGMRLEEIKREIEDE